MNTSYSKCLYHIIWTTIHREPLINTKIETFLHCYIPQKTLQYGGSLYEMNMVTDHIHLLCEVPSTVLISDFIGKLKGSSSHEVNKRNENIDFAWHEGYSVFSVGRTEIDMIQNYIKKQKTHHKQK